MTILILINLGNAWGSPSQPTLTSDTYALANGGSFSWPSGVTFLRPLQVGYSETRPPVNVAGLFSSVFDVATRMDNAFDVEELTVKGYVGTDVGVFQTECRTTVNTIDVDTEKFKITKTWPLVRVTGMRSSVFDDNERWDWGIPVYEMEYSGWPTNAGPVIRSNDLTVTFDLDSLGTISFDNTMKVTQASLDEDHANGGRARYRFSGKFQGINTYTAGDNDLSWFFLAADSVDDDPVRGNFTWTTTKEVVTGRAMLYSIEMEFDIRNGGYLGYSARLRLDDV